MTWTLRLSIVAVALLVAGAAGLVAYSYTLTPPQKRIDVVVPDDRLPR